MRIQYISGSTIYIEYPDNLVWLNDNNIIRVASSVSGESVGARVAVREPTGSQLILDYWSETNELVFLLNDTLKQLFTNNTSSWDVLVQPYSFSTPQVSFTFQMKVLWGKSFPDRSHGAATTIYWNDVNELTKLQIFSYEGGSAIVQNNSFTLAAGVNSLNLGSLSIGEDERIHILSTNVLETTPDVLGGIWSDTRVNAEDYYITLKNVPVCADYNAVRIYYNDTDGCYRWIAGKLKKETNSAKGSTYSSISSIYRNGANKHIDSTSKTVTVGYQGIDSAAYLQDIMYSEDVRMLNYNGDLVPVSVNTSKLTNEDFENDFEIEYLINSEN